MIHFPHEQHEQHRQSCVNKTLDNGLLTFALVLAAAVKALCLLLVTVTRALLQLL